MVLTVQDALDVSIHVEATRVLDVIPFKIYARKFGSFPILGNGVMWLKDISQVVDMDITNVLYAKVIDNEYEDD